MKKQLQKNEWSERLQMVSSGNRGANALLEEAGENIAENTPFRDIEYDPAKKGDDLVIALGSGDDNLRHVVASPVELYLHEDSNGVLTSVEIINNKSVTTSIRFL
jgi:hypothetical protein